MTDALGFILIWGGIATAAMTAITEGAQMLGLSRMSLPFLFGTILSGRRDRATAWGFVIYAVGGLLFAGAYLAAFASVGGGWWLGPALGLLHGVCLVTVVLPLLPFVHPRMASDFEGPSARRRLEPPGRFGLNYGARTPLVALVGQLVYGTILGLAWAAA